MMKRILSLMLTAVLITALCMSVASAEEAVSEKEYYVYTNNTGKAINVREEPNGAIVGTLEQGDKVKVVSFVNAAWAIISYSYDKEGSGEGEWPACVSRRYLIDIDPAELARVIEEEKEQYTGDVLEDMAAEFTSAIFVPHYRIIVRPARVTSWVDMRWVPSSVGPAIFSYTAGQELIVLAETAHYLQVQDPDEGIVGYIHKMFAARQQ